MGGRKSMSSHVLLHNQVDVINTDSHLYNDVTREFGGTRLEY